MVHENRRCSVKHDRERTSMESNTWAIGDSLVVKPGVTDPATSMALGGWQGRLIALDDEQNRLSIQWDSLTLKSMPPAYLVQCEEWGVPWTPTHMSVDTCCKYSLR